MNDDLDGLLGRYGDLDAATRRDPHPCYRRLRESGDVHAVTLPGGRRAWIVTGYETAKHVFTDPRFSNDPSHRADVDVFDGDRHMGIVDPPEHARLRKVVSRHFTPGAVAARRPAIQAVTDELLDGLGERVDLAAEFAAVLTLRVIFDMFGVPADEQDVLIPLLLELSRAAGTGEDTARRAMSLRDRFARLVTDRPVDDDGVLATLRKARADGIVTEGEAFATLFLIIAAGHETTVNLITVAMHTLLTHPEQLAALRADLSLVPGAVEEVLRFESTAAHSTGRYTTCETSLAGVTIPAGELVLVNLNAVNRDAACVPDPQRFSVDREPSPHLAFGYKRHGCLGASLARVETDIALTSLLRTFADIRPAGPLSEVEWKADMALRGPVEYPVVLTRSRPPPSAGPRQP